MPLPVPRLDDRSFHQLVEESILRVRQTCPEWTDLSPSDPGVVLLELFAHLTVTLISQLNRVPERAYVEFLRLLGVKLYPPSASVAVLRFQRSRPSDRSLEVPRGTRVTVGRPSGGEEPPTFVTAQVATIPAGEQEVEVLAYHCEAVEGELVGRGSGQPGLSVQVRQPPIVSPTGDGLDLIVCVEALPGEVTSETAVLEHQRKLFRIWREVENFTNLGSDRFVYVADRMMGMISFAPAVRLVGDGGTLRDLPVALAEVPPAGREIRVWYRRGGGVEGNVAAHTLTVLRDPIAGVVVTNLAPATGGHSAESLENALVRGPGELHSLQRAVTATDFELIALYSPRIVARAKAFTEAELWAHAVPGTVGVVLVPYLPEERRLGRIAPSDMRQLESETVRNQIQRHLDQRRPMATVCRVGWARYKTVQATARVVVRREIDPAAVRERVLERLYQTVGPLPNSGNSGGWPFGQALRGSHVYDAALEVPGVLWVDQVSLQVEQVPDLEVGSVASDHFQRETWHAGSRGVLFRSLNNGEGWEPTRDFGDHEVKHVRTHPHRPGLLAVVTVAPGGSDHSVHVSRDCGETWEANLSFAVAFDVEDLTWILREDTPVLLMATDVGLYEYVPRPGGNAVQVLVDPQDQSRGFYTITAARDVRGQVSVAVAAQATGGIFLSSSGGRSNTFRHIGLRGQDVRSLAVQYDGSRTFLWAGTSAAGPADNGNGCFRWELRGLEDPPEGWRTFNTGWTAGTCWGLAFLGAQVFAASFRGGVLMLDTSLTAPSWQMPEVNCGLPLRDSGRFDTVRTLAANEASHSVMAGTVKGVFLSADGAAYSPSSNRIFPDRVTLPPTWLFCSAEHRITVVGEHEAE